MRMRVSGEQAIRSGRDTLSGVTAAARELARDRHLVSSLPICPRCSV